MSLSHESINDGHSAAKKTVYRITTCLHWSGITSDVSRLCWSCEIRQKTVPEGTCKVTNVPFGQM